MPLWEISSIGGLIAANIFGWALVHWLSGRISWNMPERWLSASGWLFRPRRFEQGGRFYRRYFSIHRWKERLPDGAELFPDSFPKRRLQGTEVSYINQFITETCRAEVTHWFPLIVWPVFWLWNPGRAMPFMLLYAVLSNVPCLMAQRYNRPRLLRLLHRSDPESE